MNQPPTIQASAQPPPTWAKFAEWLWAKALPVMAVSIVPIIFSSSIASWQGYTSAAAGTAETLRKTNADIEKLKETDAAFDKRMKERSEFRDNQIAEFDKNLKRLDEKVVTREIFDLRLKPLEERLSLIEQNGARQNDTNDRILQELQRINR